MIGQFPRRIWRYPSGNSLVEQFGKLSPRQRWIAEQSIRRYERRTGHVMTVMLCEIGEWQGVKIIKDAPPR